jgi:PPOX class probable F420-dependent enzyme
MVTTTQALAFPHLADHSYMSLTTFRKSGKAVPTPVWFVDVGDRLYVTTQANAGKAKRIRNSGQVTVAPCTVQGELLGEATAATARILPESDWQPAEQALRAKYGLIWRLFSLMYRLRRQHRYRTFLEITPV